MHAFFIARIVGGSWWVGQCRHFVTAPFYYRSINSDIKNEENHSNFFSCLTANGGLSLYQSIKCISPKTHTNNCIDQSIYYFADCRLEGQLDRLLVLRPLRLLSSYKQFFYCKTVLLA